MCEGGFSFCAALLILTEMTMCNEGCLLATAVIKKAIYISGILYGFILGLPCPPANWVEILKATNPVFRTERASVASVTRLTYHIVDT